MKVRAGFVSNSSSEAFLVNTEHSAEEVKAILEEMLAFYNKIMDKELSFNEVWDDPRIFSKEDHKCLKCYGHPFGDNPPDESFSKVLVVSETDNWCFDLGKFLHNGFRRTCRPGSFLAPGIPAERAKSAIVRAAA